MSDAANTHRSRQILGAERQPDHATDLEHLQRILEDNNLEHPFDLDLPGYHLLEANPAFLHGGQGPVARCTEPHFYRLQSVSGLLNFCSSWRDDIIDPESGSGEQFLILANAFAATGEWLPLQNYAEGTYALQKRGSSFWNDTEYIADQSIVQQAYRNGLASDWVADYSVIIRCPVPDNISRAHVPTTVDAWCFSIFEPQPWREAPSHGVTVNVADLTDLHQGVNEYVLHTVPIEYVEIKPIHVRQDFRKNHNTVTTVNPFFYPAMKGYYDYLKASDALKDPS